MQPISRSTHTRKSPTDLKVVAILKRPQSLKEVVDEHIVSVIVPTLAALKSVQPSEGIPYRNTFKMFLDGKIPGRTLEETNVLYKEYIPRLTSEIAKKILDIMDKNFVSAGFYCGCFQEKFKFVYCAFLRIDNAGCELPLEEGNAIHRQVVFEAEERLLHRWEVHRTIEAYVAEFLFPFKNGRIAFDDQTALNRSKLVLGLEKHLITKFNRMPYSQQYVEALAYHHYLFECSQYILDQFEKETGVMPLYDECRKDYRYRLIFRGCLEAVLAATAIDFPDIPISSQKVSDYLYGFIGKIGNAYGNG
jgi:hypothetical protein